MIEVLSRCRSSGTTYFLAVHIMEKYLKYGPQGHAGERIHLIGIVSMFIASKYEDVNAISLKLLHKGIAHEKYDENELINMEIDILTILNFDLKHTMSCDFLGYVCALIEPPIIISRTAEIILILNKLEYNNSYMPCEEAVVALYIAARNLNQRNLANKVLKVAEFNEEEIEIYIISMQNYIDMCKIKPPKFKSPMRELGFSFANAEDPCFFKFSDPQLESFKIKLMTVF